MSQNTLVITNGTGVVVRTAINSALNSIVTNNSGATAPSVTYADMWWIDTTLNLLKMRNSTNASWVTVGARDATNLGLTTAADNPIINGHMEIWQRNTSFAAVADATYTADRWRWGQSGAGVVTITRSSASVPTVAQAGVLFNYSLDVDVTTADAALAAGDNYFLSQHIEGHTWRHFAQRIITLSFWVLATRTGTHCVSISNSGSDRSCVMTYTVSTTLTWEYKTVTFPASPSAGTWDYTTGIGARIRWCLGAGTTFQTTAGAWATGNFLNNAASVASTWDLDNTANFFRITGVKIEVGSVATPYEMREFGQEVEACERFFQKTYALTQAIGGVTTLGAERQIAYTPADFHNWGWTKFHKRMRASPVVVIYNPSTGLAGTIRDIGGAANRTATITLESSVGFRVNTAGTTINNSHEFHWTADAEL